MDYNIKAFHFILQTHKINVQVTSH